MDCWNKILNRFGHSSTEGYTLHVEMSIIFIALLSLVAAQLEAALAPVVCCAAREHMATLRTLTRALFRVANLLLVYASVIENGSLIQIYVWYTLAFIVIGFAAAIMDALLGLKHDERWCIPSFITEVVFLFVLSRCLPVVDMYRKQIIEPVHVKYSN